MGNNPSNLLEGLADDTSYLDLSNHSLETVPHEITNFSSISNLNLSGNKIAHLPKQLFEPMINLERINLSSNSLHAIPIGLRSIINLKRLILRQNNIVSLKGLVSSTPEIEELDLGHNMIKDVPHQLSAFSNLAELNLSGNKISKLVHCLSPSIRILNISENNIDSFDSSKTLPEWHDGISSVTVFRAQKNLLSFCNFQHFENIETLDLSNNFLPELHSSVALLKKLKHLILLGNRITELPSFVSNFHSLQTLDVRINQITSIPPLSHIPTLQVIKASHNPNLKTFHSLASLSSKHQKSLTLLPSLDPGLVSGSDSETFGVETITTDIAIQTEFLHDPQTISTTDSTGGKSDPPSDPPSDDPNTDDPNTDDPNTDDPTSESLSASLLESDLFDTSETPIVLDPSPDPSPSVSGSLIEPCPPSPSVSGALVNSGALASGVSALTHFSIELIADNCALESIDPMLLSKTSSLFLFNNTITNLISIPNKTIKRVTLMDNHIKSTKCFNSHLLPNLTFLNLEKNFISKVQENTISTLEHLTMLNLSRNSIPFLPNDCFVKLKSVSRIALDHNLLTNIPISISDCTSLRYFSASNNQLNFSRSKRLVDLSNTLISLNLSFNPLKTFPSSLLQGKEKLAYLYLISCRLTGTLVLATNLKLIRFNISQNQLSSVTNIPPSLKYATLALNKFTSLNFLLPASHSLKSIISPLNPIQAFPRGRFSNLETLNLSDTLFAQLPPDLPRLTHLNISNTLVTKLERSFLGSSPHLESLDITGLPQCTLRLDPSPFIQGFHRFKDLKADLPDSIARSLLFSLHPEFFEISPTRVDFGPLKVWKRLPPLLRAPIDLISRTCTVVTPSKRFRHGHVEFQGLRPSMEDSLIVRGQFLGSRCDLFAVLDGHGGWQASHWLARNLPQIILSSFDEKNIAKTLGNAIRAANKSLYDAMQHPTKPKKMKAPLVSDNLLDEDNHIVRFMRTQALSSSKNITEPLFRMDQLDHDSLITASEYHANTYVIKSGNNYPGSTLILALIVHDTLFVANIGDSRAVIGKSDGSSLDLSSDHKPLSPVEYERIRSNRGTVDEVRGSLRVNMILAVSRALGDFQLDNVSSEPEISSRTLILRSNIAKNTPGNHPQHLNHFKVKGKGSLNSNGSSPPIGVKSPRLSGNPSESERPHSAKSISSPRRTSDSFLDETPSSTVFDSVLILGCDGIWDVITSQEAVSIVLSVRNGGGSPQVAGHCLVNRAVAYGSTDNISCQVIFFPA